MAPDYRRVKDECKKATDSTLFRPLEWKIENKDPLSQTCKPIRRVVPGLFLPVSPRDNPATESVISSRRCRPRAVIEQSGHAGVRNRTHAQRSRASSCIMPHRQRSQGHLRPEMRSPRFSLGPNGREAANACRVVLPIGTTGRPCAKCACGAKRGGT